MLPPFPDGVITNSTGDAEIIMEAYERAVIDVEKRCDKCKFSSTKRVYFPNEIKCTKKELSWFGSATEYGFYPDPDFWCKFWQAKEDL